ncbi:hypothetical protein B0H16DRAFT_1364090 [Mycena metata]|uniref:NmrA-like domain-containing protein n=1 Tax=Mycena metata TaxID=1033252 RepID=A0AAD7NQS5_9AGAR|nr:hypothetical protein B0H16DRAFT_1364090 [Mycena metata]
MSTTYTSFAVFGGGRVGLPIIEEFARRQVSVVLFSRPGSASKKTVPAGVEIVELDFLDVNKISAALQQHGVQVVLSTIGVAAAVSQNKAIVDAAKLAGAKLFVPAEYGLTTEGQTEGPLGDKREVADYLKATGIPAVQFYNGLFIEFIPWLTGFPEDPKMRVIGKGETPISFTAIIDVAGFVAHVLTTLPSAELGNRIFRLEGERASLKELAKRFNATVEYVDRVQGEMGEVKTVIGVALDSGSGSTGWDVVNKREGTGVDAAGSANSLWPGHQWKTIKEVLNL